MREIDISIVIPFLNEEESLTGLVQALNSFIADHQLNAEVILVNDGSVDRSHTILSSQQFVCPVKLIKLSRNFGSHAALRAGIGIAEGKYITFTYADLQDPLEVILEMKKLILANDIVWGCRVSTEGSFSDRVFSRLYASLMRKFALKDFPKQGFDIVMFNRKVAEQLNKNPEANSSLFLQILTLGFEQTSVSYHKKSRSAGKSKWTTGKKIKLLLDSFVAFSYAPIRMVTIVGIFLFLLGVTTAGYLIIRKLVYDDLLAGWPALISILMMGFGVTNISLGIIAEYLWRALDASRNRPVYIIDEINRKNYE